MLLEIAIDFNIRLFFQENWLDNQENVWKCCSFDAWQQTEIIFAITTYWYFTKTNQKSGLKTTISNNGLWEGGVDDLKISLILIDFEAPIKNKRSILIRCD